MTNTSTRDPKDRSAVVRVKPMDVKLKNSPIRAVIAKLNPMEKVILSIMSSEDSFGNSVSVTQ